MPGHAIISRRKFLAGASLVAVSGLLAACGGSATPSPSSAAPKPASTGSIAAAKPASSASAASKPVASASASGSSAASAAASGAASAGTPSLKMAYPAVTGAQGPLFMAQELNLFDKHGVKVDAQYIEGSTATKALIAGELDAIFQAATSMITADVNGAANLVYVASAYNHAQFSLITVPAIKTVDDLKGKSWGTDHPGTTVDYFTHLLMDLLNIKPGDVELRVLGASAVLVPDLTSKQIDAAPISPPASFNFEDQGYHSLKDTYDQPYQNVGVVVSKARVPELTPAFLKMLPAYREGMQAFNEQPDTAKKVLREKAKITDPGTLDRTYEFYTKQTSFQMDLKPTLEGIQHMIDFLAGSAVPKAKGAKAEQFVDMSVLDQLKLS